MSRENWWLINRTTHPISIGDFPFVPAVEPNQKVDLLRYVSKEEADQSPILAALINNGSLTLRKDESGTSVV